jgi:hypothetical protein
VITPTGTSQGVTIILDDGLLFLEDTNYFMGIMEGMRCLVAAVMEPAGATAVETEEAAERRFSRSTYIHTSPVGWVLVELRTCSCVDVLLFCIRIFTPVIQS